MDISAASPAITHSHYTTQQSSANPAQEDTRLTESQQARKDQPEPENQAKGLTKAEQQLSDSEKRETQELQRRDQEVRAHEAAHKAAAGRYATGAVSFDYQRGPDGRQYAVGGEVSIDTSRPDNPSEALSKAQTIQAAALAPAEPSAQDRQVAQAASQMAAEARAELARQSAEQANTDTQTASGSANHSDPGNSEPGELFDEFA